ncbi:MAG: ROK family protein [Qingshengfaniella sp.]
MATRRQLADELGLSRPTLSSVMSELTSHDYVSRISEVQGPTGRKAGMYRLAPGAGHVIGIDAGSTRIMARVATPDGRELYSATRGLSGGQPELNAVISAGVAAVMDDIRIAAQSQWGPLRTIGIALPARVGRQDEPDVLTAPLFSHFAPPRDIPVLLENNVNCAAIAEHQHGIAQGHDSFAYVQVGMKIGMGLVLGGRLIRGANGATGELSWVPFPFAPDKTPAPQALETYLGAEALMTRVQDSWPPGQSPAPDTTTALFRLAEEGCAPAVAAIERQGRDLARLIAVCVAVTDPGLVVLGGGVGQNPVLIPFVQRHLEEIALPVQVITSTLGADATLAGITSMAARSAVLNLMKAPADPLDP